MHKSHIGERLGWERTGRMKLAEPKTATEKAVQMIYEAPAAGRKQSMTGYRNSGRGTEGDHHPSAPINFLSICSCFLPMGMRVAERMEMMFSLGLDIFPVKFKQCSSPGPVWLSG